MDLIDNGHNHIDNIAYKIQMIIELIEQLKKEREDDFMFGFRPRFFFTTNINWLFYYINLFFI